MQRLDSHIDMRKGSPLRKIKGNWVREIQTILEDIDVIGGHIDRQPGQGGYGWKIVIDGEGAGGGAVWDLLSYDTVNYKVSALNADLGGAWIAGNVIDTIAAGTGMTYVAADTVTPAHWTSGTMATAKQCCYLTLNRGDGTATISSAATFPNGTGSKEIFPLWKLPYDTTTSAIQFADVMDMRNSCRWIAGA